MEPIILSSNQPPNRFYLGGAQISSFRGEQKLADCRTPEDWIASTTTCRGHSTLGLSRLPDGSLLSDAIQAHPQGWLGPEHVKEFGPDTKLLVKLLDAGERLPVHAHPSFAFAKKHVGALHGKAEAWYILTPGEVYLGLRRDVSIDELLEIVGKQDVELLLALMHRVPVRAHQTVYVPPGLLHAIGKGVFLAEVQEPEDLSILLEWRNFSIDGALEGHLDIGFQKAILGVETRARSADEIYDLVRDASLEPNQLLPKEASEYFRIDFIKDQHGKTQYDSGFAVVIILDGSFCITSEVITKTQVTAGATVLIPYDAGKFTLDGEGSALVARPPLPTATRP